MNSDTELLIEDGGECRPAEAEDARHGVLHRRCLPLGLFSLALFAVLATMHLAPKGRGRGKPLESVAIAGVLQLDVAAPSGVLCQTLLHPAVNQRHFVPFVAEGLWPNLADQFNAELSRKCRKTFTANAWSQLETNYDGSWKHSAIAPHDNLIFGSLGAWLNRKRKAIRQDILQAEKNGTLKHIVRRQPNFTKLVESRNYHTGLVPMGLLGTVEMLGVPTLLRFISDATHQQKPITRVLDFGCGDGLMVADIAFKFGLAQSDTFCLDIVNYVAKVAQTKVTMLLASHNTPTEYATSLKQLLDTRKLQGTISAVTTMVTFHHIVDPQERTAALLFIRECLTEQGVLLFSDWNNAGSPIDFTIYMDLTHFLPSLFFNHPSPTNFSLRRLHTEYLSIDGWTSVMRDAGLIYDAHASNLPWVARDNKLLLLPPIDTSQWTSVLNFAAVFVKQHN